MDIRITHNVTGLQKLVERYPTIARQQSEAVLELVAARIVSDVTAKTPTSGNGFLRAGNVYSVGQEVTTGRVVAKMGNALEYARPIENGRRPGSMPPVEPIRYWVERKLGLQMPESKGVAFAIARSIMQRGYSPEGDVGPDGARMWQKTFDELDSWIYKMLDSIPRRIASVAQSQG